MFGLSCLLKCLISNYFLSALALSAESSEVRYVTQIGRPDHFSQEKNFQLLFLTLIFNLQIYNRKQSYHTVTTVTFNEPH